MLRSDGIVSDNLGFGGSGRNMQTQLLRKALESARVQSTKQSWSYKGEEADFDYYRKTDKKTPRHNVWPGGVSNFADEIENPGKVKSDGFFGMFKGNAGGEDPNMIAFIRNDESAKQSDWFFL